ncbi:MAG: ABC transporter ATP-binding protein [Candidatus Cellulosilyticum pullistercoris]|uniref:ABC transporter ATP-binding protein n=1 Tax=Candidatus Cellulosilyticum pullistercoris TaxID=2838521 RepID=A0A9E2NNY7_9FIRM|nr:ABC transporter ATP-binding protein [Candidatus Cellulosilyticum pullistercoris]
MIKIEHVSKSFDGHKVLDDVSIYVKPGTIYGIIGENGVGKSTLIQCLAGVYEQDTGRIEIDGKSIYENNEVKLSVGYVADRNQFFKGYRIEQMIDFFKLTYPSFSEERFKKYNETFKLNLKSKVKNLSKGMQMRLSLMLNMAIMPKVLILDEPTSGLDALAKKQVLDFLIEQVDETGMTVVISSHHLSELERICDEITMLSRGKVVYQSSVETLKNKVRKLQVVFNNEVPVDLKKWEGILSIDHIGSVYYIVTNEYSEALEEKLKEAGAFLVEAIGLNLEEVFVYTAIAEQVQA